MAATRWPRNDEREIDRPLARRMAGVHTYLRMYLRRARSGVERGCERQELRDSLAVEQREYLNHHRFIDALYLHDAPYRSKGRFFQLLRELNK